MLNARNTCSNDNHNLIATQFKLPTTRGTVLPHSPTLSPWMINKAPPILFSNRNPIFIHSPVHFEPIQPSPFSCSSCRCRARSRDWLSVEWKNRMDGWRTMNTMTCSLIVFRNSVTLPAIVLPLMHSYSIPSIVSFHSIPFYSLQPWISTWSHAYYPSHSLIHSAVSGRILTSLMRNVRQGGRLGLYE